MAAAANFAFANRELITHSTRQAFASAGLDPGDRPLRVLCDLAHNNAKFEEHDGREVLVHRMGATRAFGPGNEELPERYRPAGQPVSVPGDMGRYSYVLAGTEGAMSERFGSGAHGAGRKMGRRAAKRAAKGRNIGRGLEDKGILIRAANRATVGEEMPEAYKDATEVVDTTDGAGIGKKVARLRPRNRYVAGALRKAGLATLLIDSSHPKRRRRTSGRAALGSTSGCSPTSRRAPPTGWHRSRTRKTSGSATSAPARGRRPRWPRRQNARMRWALSSRAADAQIWRERRCRVW